MSDFRFNRLEKYKIGGTHGKMELRIPLPQSPTGKTYRWCPNEICSPRLFLLGDTHYPENLDTSQMRRAPGAVGTTCPYCGNDADDGDFTYDGDIEAIKKYVEWAVLKDVNEHFSKLANSINRSQHSRFISLKMTVKPDRTPEPRAWREDLIRNLACNICGREYGVYAIGLYCPDCGCKNFGIHFEREVELILQQIDLAEQVSAGGNIELSYRVLGNAHEDVLTAFETYQKTFYKYMIRRSRSQEDADRMLTKRAIGNRFQNIDRAKELYSNLSIDPFVVLSESEIRALRTGIEKRHVIGHNLSIVDETYSDNSGDDQLGTTVAILADEISEFVTTSKKVILELQRLTQY